MRENNVMVRGLQFYYMGIEHRNPSKAFVAGEQSSVCNEKGHFGGSMFIGWERKGKCS